MAYIRKYSKFKERETLTDGVEYIYPDPPNLKDIVNYKVSLSRQKHFREPTPEFMRKKYLVSHPHYKKDQLWFLDDEKATKEQVAYIDQQFKKMRDGEYRMINGELRYLTGLNWFYLQWYSLGAYYPDYRDRDRRQMLMWDWVKKNPDLAGMIHPKHRGEGASFMGGCAGLYEVLSAPYTHAGFQNKVGEQAESKFNEIVMQPFLKLPFHLLPLHVKGSTDNKGGLYLYPSERKLTHKTSIYDILAEIEEFDPKNPDTWDNNALNSKFTWRKTKANAYDGETLHFKLDDEVGKYTECRYDDVLNVTLLCFRDPKRKGKLWACSSSPGENEKEESNKAYQRSMGIFRDICMDALWKKVHPKTGKRVSKLVTYFVPANDGLVYDQTHNYFDEFGNSKILEADNFLNEEITTALASNDVHKSISFRRQYPRTLEECFLESSDTAPWNIENVLRLEYELTGMGLNGHPKIDQFSYRANLAWDETGKTVKILPSQTGRFVINRMLDTILLAGEKPLMKLNDIRQEGMYMVPMNQLPILIGIDPFKYKRDDLSGSVKYHSKGAALAWLSHVPELDGPIPTDEEQARNPYWARNTKSNSFIIQYLYRTDDPHEMVDDILKMCVLLGRQAMIEVNADSFKAMFEVKGGTRFVKKSYGILTPGQAEAFNFTKGRSGHYTDEKTHENGTSWWASVYQDHAYPHKIPFLEILDEAKRFNLAKVRQFDLHMAGMMIAVWDNEIQSRQKREEASKSIGKRRTQTLNWHHK